MWLVVWDKMTIQDAAIRERVETIVRRLLEGVMSE